MAELFKDMYNDTFFKVFTDTLLKVKPDFNTKSFLKGIYDSDWEHKELKQRMRHTTVVLKDHLYNDYERNVPIILQFIEQLNKEGIKQESVEYMFLPDFIEVYGLENYDLSIKALEGITKFTSCEFAVRPFIIKYPEKMMAQMLLWSDHEHWAVRRLSTEGCRPRLPWAMAIPFLKADPSPILPILEKLKADDSESVRRSVANNLNDISKDNPDLVIKLAKKWHGNSKNVDWVVKHACRTLLKQGNQEIMPLFGFGTVEHLKINSFKILTPQVKVGEALEFEFQLHNTSDNSTKIRLEYALYYQKANGSLAPKVFKISEKEYAGNSSTTINRKQSFKVITTRVFHTGKHQVSIILNGKEFDKLDFELIT